MLAVHVLLELDLSVSDEVAERALVLLKHSAVEGGVFEGRVAALVEGVTFAALVAKTGVAFRAVADALGGEAVEYLVALRTVEPYEVVVNWNWNDTIRSLNVFEGKAMHALWVGKIGPALSIFIDGLWKRYDEHLSIKARYNRSDFQPIDL